MKKFKKDILKSWWNKNLDYLPLGSKWRGKWQKRTLKRLIKEIDNRVLDIEVAEKVFGHKIEIIEFKEYNDYDEDHPELAFKEMGDEYEQDVLLPNYSTDIKDAWQILRADKIPLDHFTIYFPDQYNVYYTAELNEIMGEGTSESEAICIAALEYIDAK